MPGPLGCGLMGAALVAREAPRTILHDLSGDITEGSCNRKLNEISSAQLTLTDCYDGPTIIPWQHALLLSWDDQFLWYGPVTDIEDNEEGFGIVDAQDLMVWMMFRKLRDDFTSIGTPVDVATIFATILAQGFAQDPTVAYTLTQSATGILAEREYLASQHQYVFDFISELATTGIDWTVILDEFLCGDVDIATTPIGVLNASHLVNKPSLKLAGSSQANFETVMGDGTALGLAQDAASQVTFGLLDRVDHESTILDSTSAQAAAATRLAFRKNSPIVIGNMILQERAPLDLADLKPGAIITVSLDGNHVSYAGDVRLNAPEFNVNDGRWVATINAQPVGTTS